MINTHGPSGTDARRAFITQKTMIAEKTITICGQEVIMRYCAATETGYEALSGKPTDIFIPQVLERDAEGKATKVQPPQATADDYLKLAVAAMTSAYEVGERYTLAYACRHEDVPINVEQIMYEAGPEEITSLITTIIDLRNMWYQVPSIVPKEDDVSEEDQDQEEKN